jgi:chaperone modulatory protein CbpM
MDSIEVSESPWLDAQRRIGQADLAKLCGIPGPELDALVKLGGLVPLSAEGPGRRQFSGGWVMPLRHAAHLRTAHGLDLFTTSLVLGYLHRIAQLEHQLRALQPHQAAPVQLPREGPTPWREPHA